MNTIDEMAVEIHENGKSLKRSLKDKMFDVIGVGLVIAVGLVSLGIIELREITPREIVNIVLEAVPFYIGCVTLAMNYYRKGVYAGKESVGFSSVVKKYSKKVNVLNGKQLENLNDFCCEYNEKGLRIAQENILRNAAVRYDRFNCEWEDKDGNVKPALKTMSKETLVTEYNARIAECIIKARDTEVKGITANVLLGNTYDWDITNLGPNEKELASQRRKQYAGSSAISIILLSLMAVKNIVDWGWVGFVLVTFKLIWVLCNSYLKYFEGYDDITIRVCNHISRKMDVLKQYDYWYYLKFPKEMDLSDPEYEWLSNISDNSLIYYNNEGRKTGDVGTSPKNVEGVLNV